MRSCLKSGRTLVFASSQHANVWDTPPGVPRLTLNRGKPILILLIQCIIFFSPEQSERSWLALADFFLSFFLSRLTYWASYHSWCKLRVSVWNEGGWMIQQIVYVEGMSPMLQSQKKKRSPGMASASWNLNQFVHLWIPWLSALLML